ncbi:MAG: hypothetical protein ACK4SY_07180 [Pyrobaculum sp.]
MERLMRLVSPHIAILLQEEVAPRLRTEVDKLWGDLTATLGRVAAMRCLVYAVRVGPLELSVEYTDGRLKAHGELTFGQLVEAAWRNSGVADLDSYVDYITKIAEIGPRYAARRILWQAGLPVAFTPKPVEREQWDDLLQPTDKFVVTIL